MLVKVIKAGHSEYQRKYMIDNNLRFVRIDAYVICSFLKSSGKKSVDNK